MPTTIETEPVWKDIITGDLDIEFEFFPARLLQGILVRSFHRDPSPEKLAKCASELRNLFLQNEDLPSASRDLKRILG